MAKEFNALNENDTKELRKELGLPITKQLVYWKKQNLEWVSFNVLDYEVVEVYEPSHSSSLMITIDNGEKIRILGDFFADMQKPSFVSDMEKNIE